MALQPPANYILPFRDPVEQVLKGFDAGLGGRERVQGMHLRDAANARAESAEARAAEMHPLKMQGLELGNQRTEQQMAEAARLAERSEALTAEMGRLIGLGVNMTFDDVVGVMEQFPEASEDIMEAYEAMGEAQQKPMNKGLAQAIVALKAGSVEVATNLLDEYIEAARNSGDERSAALAEAMKVTIEMDPDAALATMGSALAITDPQLAQSALGRTDSTDSNVQSTTRYNDGTVAMTLRNGQTVVRNPVGDVVEGQDRLDTLAAARQSGIDDREAEAAATATGRLETEIELGGTVAAAEALPKIQSTIGTLEQVKEAIDAGASTGVIQSRFPAWSAATIEIRRLQNELGLDVIGSVTFGALSQEELRLALRTALPLNMEGEDLKQWVDDRIAAQEKLYAYLEKQARYLMRPGNTIEGWMDLVDQGNGAAGSPPQAPAQDTPDAPSAPAPPAFDPSLFEKYLD